MAVRGTAFFDGRGQYFRSAEEATISDLASILGRVGEGDSLAPGIAKTLLLRRREIQRIFDDHDAMIADGERVVAAPPISDPKVAHFPTSKAG